MSILPVERSKKQTAINSQIILIYGRPKIGKSTFCAKFNKAVFLATEPGLNHQEVYKVNVNSWGKFLEACSELAKGQHDFETIAIDTVDSLITYCSDHVCKENNINHPSELAHGKGWSMITLELNRALIKLASLPYGMILVSHCEVNEIETKTKKYNRWSISIGGKNKNIILNLADIILFVDSEVDKDGNEVRLMRTKPSINYDAGDRSNLLPETLGLDYNEFAGYFS
jgi:hypothetical protein